MDTILETIQNFEQRIAEAHDALNIANEQLNQLMTPQKQEKNKLDMLMEEFKMETQAEAAAFLQRQRFQQRKLEILASLDRTETELGTLQTVLKTKQDRFSALRDMKDSKIADSKHLLESFKSLSRQNHKGSRIISLRTQLDQILSQIDQSTPGQLDTRLKEIQVRVVTAKAANAILESRITEIKSRISEIQPDVQRHQESLDELRKKIQRKEKQISAVRSIRAAYQTESAQVELKIIQLRQTIKK